MSTDKEGLHAIWPKGHKWPNWSLLGVCIVLFFLGYIVGEHSTQRAWEAIEEKMVKTNVIEIGDKRISLDLPEEKRREISAAMNVAIEEREGESANESQANR